MINETIKNLERIEFHAFGFVDYFNNYSSFGSPVEEVLSKVHHSYNESIEKYHKMIELHRVLFSYIDNPPFYVTQIAN